MKLLVGLGNPGVGHALQRHNVGFMALDAVASMYPSGKWRSEFRGLVCKLVIDGVTVLAIKPLTYMNASGKAVQAISTFHRIPCSDIVVLHDEIDLSPGKVKVKIGGGHAGHNGIRSIQSCIGPDFCRVRFGIGRDSEQAATANWVLSNFTEQDRLWLPGLLERVAYNMGKLIKGDTCGFMNGVANTGKSIE